VKIRNIRGFGEVDLDFSRPDGSLAGWTVLAGRNGSGKSTLLKALALGAAGPNAYVVLSGGAFLDWIRLDQITAQVELWLDTSLEDGVFTQLLRPTLKWRRDRPKLEPELYRSFISSNSAQSTDYDLWSSNPKGLFIVAYGPYRRLTGHASDAQRLMEGPNPVSGIVSLFREDASLVECVSWLREVYLQRLENRPGAAELEQTVLALLNDGLLPDKAHVENIDSEGLWVQQYGVRLPLSQLSDGYRTIAALSMDIVRHLHRHFGQLTIETVKDEQGSFKRILHSGVVLIDEVDLHLHVSWQKRIGFWLKRHFPNIQFIVTTHSPFICQAADPQGLIRLPAPGEDRPAEHVSGDLYNTVVNGSADDAVLTELFGLETPYSEPAERLREDVARLEAKLQTGKASDRDRSELKDLRSRLPQNLSTDVEQALRKLAAEG
jgi:energy-coupling factor transporter ATP-binding protein EcfA2